MERTVKVHHQEADGRDTNNQRQEGTSNPSRQEKYIRNLLPESGVIKGLAKSFRASAKGTGSPHKEGFAGPTRSMRRARTFRSRSVKKPTAINRRKVLRKDGIKTDLNLTQFGVPNLPKTEPFGALTAR